MYEKKESRTGKRFWKLKTNTTINCPIEGLRDKVEEI
jgi:hypothetical protein